MKLLMISGDRTAAAGKAGAFSDMLGEFSMHFERIDVICPRVSAERLVHSIRGNVFFHPSPSGRLAQPFFIRRKGAELVALHKHDVATVHDYPPFLNGLGARMLMKVTDIPAVLEIHHIVGWPHAASVSEFVGRWMTRLLIASHSRHFAAVRTVNITVKAQLAAWGVSPEKISVISSVYLDHAVLDAAKNQPKKFDLVFAARLTDNKGLHPVIDAVASVEHAMLLVVGDGPQRAKAEARVKSLGIADRVTFTGWLPTAIDVAKAIASGKIFVMNSRSEGNPRVAVEAMALGVPVIATRVGIMPDVIEDGVNGTFTDGTAADLTAKIATLLADPAAIRRMGASAAGIRSRFEKKTAIKAYADFLKSHVH